MSPYQQLAKNPDGLDADELEDRLSEEAERANDDARDRELEDNQ
jgi:hypothetical protein